MSSGEVLKELLRPLGVYDLEGGVSGASLDIKGAALDTVAELLEEVERESDLTRAEGWGLENWRRLMDLAPAARDGETLRRSIAALLRIRPGAATLATMNDTLAGCGWRVAVRELGAGRVEVRFPGVAGIPEPFDSIQTSIEEILPAHVEAAYCFYYLVWRVLEERGWTFAHIEGLTWDQLEKSV